MINQDYILLGKRLHWLSEGPFQLPAESARRHIYIIGKTGSGKTTLLMNMMAQQIRMGHGVGIIDPHGDMAQSILDCIPRERVQDVVYFSLADEEHPVSFNILSNVAPGRRTRVTDALVGSFRHIWKDSWGPRMEYILHNAIAALLECQNVTILGINRMLTDERYLRWVVKQVKDPVIKNFWENEFPQYQNRFGADAVAPIQNKIGQFLNNPVTRNIFGQVKSKVDIAGIINDGKILIVNLSKGQVGEDNANLVCKLPRQADRLLVEFSLNTCCL